MLEHGIEIGKDKIHLLNRTEADRLKHVPEEVGDGYVAILEVYHQLHCLVSPASLHAIRSTLTMAVHVCRT